jgi:hypothetical protein
MPYTKIAWLGKKKRPHYFFPIFVSLPFSTLLLLKGKYAFPPYYSSVIRLSSKSSRVVFDDNF